MIVKTSKRPFLDASSAGCVLLTQDFAAFRRVEAETKDEKPVNGLIVEMSPDFDR
jgi:hypothetical protein